MLGSLRDKFSHLQEGLVGTITGGEPTTTITTPSAQQQIKIAQDKEQRIARQAGGDILFHFQNCWEKLHVGAEQCGRQADRCDRLISQVHAEYDKRWRHVAMLSSLVEGLPEMDRNISNIIQELRHMEILFSNVELALQNLEDTIHAQETREKQQQMRFDMRVYEEKRKHELLDLEEHLKKQQQKSLKEAERRENQIKLERQNVFQTKFQEDLKVYQESGFLDVPLSSHNIDDVTLESINLSGDENELEDFLNSDATDLFNLGRSRYPTQNFLSVPDRKRKTLSGPPTVNNSSSNRGQFSSGGRTRDVSNDKRYMSNVVRDGDAQNDVRGASNDVRGRGSATPGMTAIDLAAEVGTNTVDTLLAAGSIGVDLTAVTIKAAGTVGNVAAGSIGNAAVGLGSAAGTIGYVAADSIGTAAGSLGSAAGSIGYVAADAAGTIGSAAVEMTAATLTVANQGINIGDEILTDAILTAVDESGGNESVIVQPLDISPTELAITGIDGFVGSNSQEEEERKKLLTCPSSTSKDKLAAKKNNQQDAVINDASNNKTEKITSNETSRGPTEILQSIETKNAGTEKSKNAGIEKFKSAPTGGHVVTVSAVMSDSSGAGSPEEGVDGAEGMVSDSSIYFTPSQTMDNINLE